MGDTAHRRNLRHWPTRSGRPGSAWRRARRLYCGDTRDTLGGLSISEVPGGMCPAVSENGFETTRNFLRNCGHRLWTRVSDPRNTVVSDCRPSSSPAVLRSKRADSRTGRSRGTPAHGAVKEPTYERSIQAISGLSRRSGTPGVGGCDRVHSPAGILTPDRNRVVDCSGGHGGGCTFCRRRPTPGHAVAVRRPSRRCAARGGQAVHR